MSDQVWEAIQKMTPAELRAENERLSEEIRLSLQRHLQAVQDKISGYSNPSIDLPGVVEFDAKTGESKHLEEVPEGYTLLTPKGKFKEVSSPNALFGTPQQEDQHE